MFNNRILKQLVHLHLYKALKYTTSMYISV